MLYYAVIITEEMLFEISVIKLFVLFANFAYIELKRPNIRTLCNTVDVPIPKDVILLSHKTQELLTLNSRE